MPRSLLAVIRDLIEGNPAIRKVADDPALTAELLLLFRMALADGEVREREMDALKRIAAQSLGIEDGDFAVVVKHLQDFGYETTAAQAIAVFQELDFGRRQVLAQRMAQIAKADHELSGYEVRLLARVAEILDLAPSDVVGPDGALH